MRIIVRHRGHAVPGARRSCSGATDLGLFFFPTYRLFLIVVTALVLLALWLFLEKTPYGLIIRAGARDQEIVRVLGVDVSRVWLIVFGVGVALAGLAGVLAAPIHGVFPEMGIPILVDAFVVTVIGGMGSLMGAVVAGLLVGVVVSFTSFYFPQTGDAVDLRPHGAGAALPSAGPLRPRRGARLMAAGAQAAGGTDWRLRAAPLIGLIARHRVLAAVIFLAVFPWLAPYKALAVNILIFGLFALGFNLIYGYAGMLSFGHAALFGRRRLWLRHADREVRRAVVHRPAARRRHRRPRRGGDRLVRDPHARHLLRHGDARACRSVVYYVVFQWVSLTGGEDGLRGVNVPAIDVFGAHLNFVDPTVKYYVILAFVAAAMWVFSRILASPFGAVMEAIRENERRAAACGYDVNRTRWLAFILSGALLAASPARSTRIHLSIVPIETLHYLTSAVVRDDVAARRHGHLLRALPRRARSSCCCRTW